MLELLLILSVFDPHKPLIINEIEAMRHGNNAVKAPQDTAVTDFMNQRINSVTTNIQNEEQIAINPLDSMNMVAAWRDFRLGYRRVGVGYTLDGGVTWHDTLLSGTPYAWDSDPGITVDADGNFYVVVLSLPEDASTSGIFVFKSSDGGVSWSGPYTVVDENSGVFEDKELIACDRVPDSPHLGNLYVAWTRFYDYINGGINFAFSQDGGVTWNGPIHIGSAIYGVQWPVTAVGDSGTVYVAWLDFSYNRLVIAKSTDGGATFSDPEPITNINNGWFYINPDLLVISYPSLGADVNRESPYYGYLYVAYADSTANRGSDVFFRRSTDGGETWSQPIRLSDDSATSTADQFHPWLDVDQNGVITVIFYDRRNDTNNLLMDVYITQSFDGGETWTPNRRVTSVSSDPSASKSGLIGEYIGLDTWNAKPFMVWTDTREGTQDVYFGMDTTEVSVSESPVAVEPVRMLKQTVVRNYIELSAETDEPIEIYSASGALLRKFPLGRRKISVSDLPSGIYMLRAGRSYQKFVKVR